MGLQTSSDYVFTDQLWIKANSPTLFVNKKSSSNTSTNLTAILITLVLKLSAPKYKRPTLTNRP